LVQKIIECNDFDDAVSQITHSRYGSHFIVVYPDLKSLRRLYVQLIKQHIEENNDIVLFLPFYETTDAVRHLLLRNKINAIKYENEEESLIIMDAARAYFGFSIDIVSFISSLTNHASELDKNGVSVFTDMGSFFYYNKVNELIKHETSLPPLSFSKSNIKHKEFCFYNKLDYNRLAPKQKQSLLEHHGKELIIIDRLRCGYT
jgi:hypothetical protein